MTPPANSDDLPPELDRRIRDLEDESRQGAGFTTECWAWLVGLGVILPALLLLWGWPL